MSARRGQVAKEDNEASRRRVRNRLAQRHFRERKSHYIKELEERIQATQLNESERNKTLIEEITQLRSAVLKLRSQVSTIAHELESVSDDIGHILNVDQGGRKAKKSHSASDTEDQELQIIHEPASTSFHVVDDAGDATNGPSDANLVSDEPVGADLEDYTDGLHLDMTSYQDSSLPADMLFEDASQAQFHEATFDAVSDHPNIVHNVESGSVADDVSHQNHQVQPLLNSMRPFGFGSAQSVSSPMTMPATTGFSLPPGHFPPALDTSDPSRLVSYSRFSQHIETLELQARRRLDAAPNKSSSQALQRYSSAIISAFVNSAWPQTWSVWFQSQVPDIIGPILSWRVHPTIDSYQRLLPDYKPTQIQLREPHSAIIDWVPYAPLRDRIIMFYNASAELDRLICDMLNSYVIEVADLSHIVSTAPPGRAYFGIWNMFSALDATLTNLQSLSGAASAMTAGPGPEGSSVFARPDDISHLRTKSVDFAMTSFESGLGNNFDLADILKSPQAVVAFSRNIRLHQATTWRLDPSLFDKWPELKFDGYENVTAKGRSYRLPSASPQAPTEMTAPIMQAYQEAIRDAL